MNIEQKKLYRSRTDRMLTGLSGGLGKYFNVDSTMIRLIFIMSLFFSMGTTLVLYFAMAVIVPLEPETTVS